MSDTEDAYDPARYGDACASFYDEIYGPVPRALLQALIALAGSGRALELGSATGRVAIALCNAGLEHYVGVEASPAMIAAMRAKPEGRALTIVHGDFSECALPGKFELIFALASTFNLLPVGAQANAFAHLAAHLQPGGCLLLESFDTIAEPGEDRMRRSTHRLHTAGGIRDYPVAEYRSTLAERDAMAAAAGLRLAARWSDWYRSPHAGEPQHISLYR